MMRSKVCKKEELLLKDLARSSKGGGGRGVGDDGPIIDRCSMRLACGVYRQADYGV